MIPAFRLKTPEQRLAALNVFDAAKAEGKSNRAAAKIADLSFVTAWRYRRLFKANGLPGLVRRTSPGRRSLLDILGIDQTTRELMQRHRLAADCRSHNEAVRRTALDRSCPEEQRLKLLPYARLRGDLPNAFNRLLRVQRTRRVQVQIEFRCGEFTRKTEVSA